MIRAAQGQERAGGGDHRLGGEDLQDLCSQVGTGAVGTYNFLNEMRENVIICDHDRVIV